MNNQLLFFLSVLVGFVVSFYIFKQTKEGYAYEYPYSFFQCAGRRCPFENRQAPYMTDEDAFIRVY